MIANNVTGMLVNLSKEGSNQLISICCHINHGIHVNEVCTIGFQIMFVFSQSEHFHLVENSCLEGDGRQKEMIHQDGPNIGSIIPKSRISDGVLNQLLYGRNNRTKNEFGEGFTGVDIGFSGHWQW